MENEPLQIISLVLAVISLLGGALAHVRIRSTCCGSSSCSVDPVVQDEEGRHPPNGGEGHHPSKGDEGTKGGSLSDSDSK